MSKEQQYDYALLNAALYNPDPQSVLNKYERGSKFEILEEDTNDMVVKNKNTGKIILVLKGTDLTNQKNQLVPDMIQNVGIFLNKKNMVTRTKKMETKANRLERRYGEGNVVITGHSLAGYQAAEISNNTEIPAVAFNIGSSPFYKKRINFNKNVKHYTTNVGTNIDPISVTAARADFYDRVQVQPKEGVGSGVLKNHTISHFLEDVEKKENNFLGNNKRMESKYLKKKIRDQLSSIEEKSEFTEIEEEKEQRKRDRAAERKEAEFLDDEEEKEDKQIVMWASQILDGELDQDLVEEGLTKRGIELLRSQIAFIKGEKPPLPKTLPKIEKPPPLPKYKPLETDIVRAELQKRIRRDQEEEEEGEFNWNIEGPRSRRLLRTQGEEKYDQPESDRMDQDDVFSDNMIRGVNAYNSFLPNPLVPIRGRYSEFSAASEIRELNRNMRNDPNPEVNPPQNILQQNEILEGDMDRMPANEPGNPIRNALDIAGNNLYSMDQRAFLNRRRGVRERHQAVVGADDEFFVEGEVEEGEPDEGKYNDEDYIDNEVSGLTNRERNEMQLRTMQLQQLRRDAPAGKEWDYMRSALKKGDSFNISNSATVNALRKNKIDWKRPTRTRANNNIGLIRGSNRAMVLAVNAVMP